MSGVEIIGLVLGALPLIISFFEHVKGASRRAHLLTHFHAEYAKCLRDLEDEHLMFRLQLKKLLIPLVNDDVLEGPKLDELMVHPEAGGWNDEDLDVALRDRLGEAHDGYFRTVSRLQDETFELWRMLGCDHLQPFKAAVENLKLIRSHDPLRSKKKLMVDAYGKLLNAGLKYEGERMKFACNKSDREESLRKIHGHNKKLDKLLERSDEVATLQQSKTLSVSPRAVKSLLQYWHHADRIYALLYQSWACPCKGSHCAHLWLQHQTSASFEFKILVLFSPRGFNVTSLPPWQQQGLQIKELGKGVVRQVIMPALLRCPTVPAYKAQSKGILRKLGGLKKSVVLDPPLPAKGATSPEPSNSGSQATVKKARIEEPADTGQSGISPLEEISDLCNAMTNCGMQAAFIGSLTDRLEGHTYSVSSQPEQKVACGEITLREILDKSYKPRLQRAERFLIALKVASSHLQLLSTSWARKQWQAADVRFPCYGIDQKTVLFEKPYVSAGFGAVVPAGEKLPQRSDRSFVCLGLMLLELLFGEVLEEHDLWQQPGFANKDDPLYRLMVARQWADDVEGEAGAEYSAAIMWCLNESPVFLDGNQWRQDLADRVVIPLQHCCDWIHAKVVL